MRILSGQNVFDASIGRIRWLFHEFEHLYVEMSGGKDSTVIFNLCAMVAEELGRLPLRVVFIDQEAEWESAISYIRSVMTDPRVEPWWVQMPMRISNATSQDQKWLYCWEDGKESDWIRQREPYSITENVYGTMTFAEIFTRIMDYHHPSEKSCMIGGVRTEESPGRYYGLTTHATYKGRTWGKVNNKKGPHVSMYPIYDWSYRDVWKAIESNSWSYCKIYDLMYQHGVPAPKMRVSSIHHETAVRTLMFVHELEAETWARAQRRIQGVNAAKHMGAEFLIPKTLPSMFLNWKEYRDFLLERLITKESRRSCMRRQFASMDSKYSGVTLEKWYKTGVLMVLTNDHFSSRALTFGAANLSSCKTRGVRSGLS
jgi:predicted phosphoadenosine phosphosulfate sulfurtransferase